MKEYKSFYKEATGNEGGKCRYNKRREQAAAAPLIAKYEGGTEK